MTALWWSQPFAPEGSTSAEGIVKQLGTPSLDPLTVLVREAAQNTWDARRDDCQPAFRLSLRRLGKDLDAWRDLLLPGPDILAGVVLDDFLAPDTLLLTVSDRGTVGLGGPLRAGHRPAPGERSDFVQFIRNIGEPNDNRLGGGTYGFGKGIFYRISTASTIVVDTRTVEDGAVGRRLIGSSLGPGWFDANDRRYTGRHWFGDVVDDVPDPLLGDHAARCAEQLGLPGFIEGATGTDIVVIAPDLGAARGVDRARTPSEAADFLVSSVVWHLWPKLVPDSDGRAMQFAVDLEDSPLAVPDPTDTAELAPFVRALRRIRVGAGDPYQRTVAPKYAGSFAMESDAVDTDDVPPAVAAARPFDGPSHHVARMRSAELVVDYLEAAPHPHPQLRYAAVFKASDDADLYFAVAEPPTHDAWVESGLTGTARGVVQNARHFVHRRIEAGLRPNTHPGGDDTVSLGELASRLAGLISPSSPDHDRPGADNDGGRTNSGGHERGGDSSRTGSGGGGGPGGTAAGVPRLIGVPFLYVGPSSLILVGRVAVRASHDERAVTAEAHVTIDGGPERLPPLGAAAPAVLGWAPVEQEFDGGPPLVDGPDLRLPAGPDCEWWVTASPVPDAMVSLRVRVAPRRRHAE